MKIAYEGEKWMPEAVKMGAYVFKIGEVTEVPDDIGKQIMAKPIAADRKFRVIPEKAAKAAGSGKKEA